MKKLNISLFDCNGHLSDYAIIMLTSGGLNIKSRIEVLEHIGCCDECANKITQGFDERQLTAVPNDFSQNIYSHINKSETKRQRKNFVLYCTRLAAAICLTLICIYTGIFSSTITFIQQEIPIKDLSIKAPDLSFTDKISESISSFTNNIMNLEGYNNAKKEG